MALIVVMEDDAATRLIVAGILRKIGHTVHEAADGQEGLALVEQWRPDLVVSDLHMPQLNGLQVLRKLRADERFAAMPVIVLTGLDDGPAMMASMDQGANDYITKPCKASALIEAVHAQLQRSSSGEPVLAPMPVAANIRTLPDASLLLVEVRNASAIAASAGAQAWQAMQHKLLAALADRAHLAHALSLSLVGEHVLAVFADTGPGTPRLDHGERAGFVMKAWMHEIDWLCERMLTNSPPQLSVLPQLGLSLHRGSVQLMDNSVHAPGLPPVPIGETVTQLMRLRSGVPPITWPALVTGPARASVTDFLRVGAHERVMVGSQILDIHAVLGAASQVA